MTYVFNVLITARSFGFASGEAMDAFKNNHAIKVVKLDHTVAFNEQEMYNLVPGQDAVIVGTDKITKKVIAGVDRLKVISKHGVGVDNVDIAAATEAGIIVTNLLGINNRALVSTKYSQSGTYNCCRIYGRSGRHSQIQ
ncbi:hypothetical protein ES708_27908 [subsurface metagenome]